MTTQRKPGDASFGKVRFEANKNFQQEISQQVKDQLFEVAKEIASTAESMGAPRIMPREGPAFEAVRDDGSVSGVAAGALDLLGDLAGDIGLEGVSSILGIASSAGGSGVRVIARDYGGHIVELGSINSPAYAPLRRALSQLGLKLETKVEG